MPTGVYIRTTKPKIKKICKQCGKKFEVYSSSKNQKYCSQQCYWKSTGGRIVLICQTCDREFEVIPSNRNRKYCSQKCCWIASRGKPSWLKGLTKETDERVAKMGRSVSKALKGKKRVPLSKETKEKISRGNTGKIRTPEAKKQWSKVHTGMKQSEKTKRKRSKSMMGVGKGRKYPENLYPNRGMRGKSNYKLKGVPLSRERLKKILKRISLRPTSLEKKFQDIVSKYNLPYKYVGDGSFILGGKCPDFINTNNEKIAIEVYAPIFKEWSFKTAENWKRKRLKLFKSFGWKIIFFEDKEVDDNFVLRTLQEGLVKW